MNKFSNRSLCDLSILKDNPEQHFLFLIFSNFNIDLIDYLQRMTPLCQHSWITSQQLISIASSLPYHKSYFSLLKYIYNYNLSADYRHSLNCNCMKIDLNKFNSFGITPFLKSLPCSYELLHYQVVTIGANVYLTPRYPLYTIISPLFTFMKHLVDQVYDQALDGIEVDKCVHFLCSLGLNPNDLLHNVTSNLMVLFSISADISVQSDFPNKNIKIIFLTYLDRILSNLLKGGLDPSNNGNRNKLSYELHGDGLFDFIFMLKYPNDEESIEHIYKWLKMLIQYGCDPEIEMRSKCRDLLRFKSISEKPNNALSVFYYIINELFDEDFVDSPNIRKIDYIFKALTSQRMENLTIEFFKKRRPESPFLEFFSQQPRSLKFLSRFVVISKLLIHCSVDIDRFNIPAELARYTRELE